ncbi:WD40 repeat-like protein [Coprinopsis marcescibilis]|uniref:WD40 repeat-like protein n=1 Tax=Coprinopsis marcescibilis TaxID=230819 RepID=A0A5C3KM81_COPMA|nr:WD40 repeat-like protein [Coprinopsis marcescibilis]
MSSQSTFLFPPNPTTSRGSSTKLSSNKDRIVYTTGKVVVVRDLKNPALTFAYTGHTQNATVARISPSGYYCASADATGTVRVWDIAGEDKTLKGEYKALAGRVNDLAWDGESKRIIAVGDGRDKFGHAFMMDSGSSTGEIIGHSKAINAVSIRHQRPFRAATAGDDTVINFHTGVPFKYDKSIKTHSNFVHDVQFSPSGDHFVSVGSDAKFFIYDGKTGDTVGEFTDTLHRGSIMAASWSLDNKSIITSSADRSVKLWDAETRKTLATWIVGAAVEHQQVGNTWSPSVGIVSLSISGELNVFDPRVSDKPTQVYSAPQTSITSFIPAKEDTFIAGTSDGRAFSYSTSDEQSAVLQGPGHSAFVTGIAASSSGNVAYSIGYDDEVRELDPSSTSYLPASIKTSAQPRALGIAGDGTVFVAEPELVEAFRSNQKVFELKPTFKPTTIAASGSNVAVGAEDNKVYLFEWDGKTLRESGVLDSNKGPISALAFSPDGDLLAAGDAKGKIMPYNIKEKKHVTALWVFHTSRINSLAWTSDSKFCASGSLDTNIYVWSLGKPAKKVAIKEANPGGVNAVEWTNGGKDGRLVSGGADGCARVWQITFPEV